MNLNFWPKMYYSGGGGGGGGSGGGGGGGYAGGGAAGGDTGSKVDNMDYITMASDGNAIHFGNL